MLVLRGACALSDFRKIQLADQLRNQINSVQSVSATFIHFIHSREKLSDSELEILRGLLCYGETFADVRDVAAGVESGENKPLNWNRLVIPRLGTISPWASKATDIAHNVGLDKVLRIERGVEYQIQCLDAAPDEQQSKQLESLLHDRMTETIVGVDDGDYESMA